MSRAHAGLRILVLGNGYAGARVAGMVASLPGAELAGFATAQPTAEFGDVPVISPDFLISPPGIAWVRARAPEWLLCINTTVLLPSALLDALAGKALNCHPGPLPEYGGLHAHQWAIRHGARMYGVTVHRITPRLDAGPIVAIRRFPIRDSDTGLTLFRTALVQGVLLLTTVTTRLVDGEMLAETRQDPHALRLYRHREALDGRIDWRLPARALIDFVRAGNYEPLRSPTYTASFVIPSGATVEVLRCAPAGETRAAPGTWLGLHAGAPVIACGDGQALTLVRARVDGRILNATTWRDLIREASHA